MSNLTEILKMLEEVVRAPLYSVVGISGDKLVFMTNEEGVESLWYYDFTRRKTEKLCKDIYGVASVVKDSPYIIFTRDVSKGRELQQVFVININNKKEFKFENFTPKRIFSIDYNGELIALSAVSEKGIGLWIGKPFSELEKVYETDKIMIVYDLSKDYVVGYGVLKGNPKSYELFFFNLNTNEFETYTPKEGSVNKMPVIHNHKVLFVTSAFNGKNMLKIVDVETKELSDPKFTYSDYTKYNIADYVSLDWTEDGKAWFIGKFNGMAKAFIDGKEVPTPEGFVSYLTIRDNMVYITYSSFKRPHCIYEVNLKTGEGKVLLGHKLSEKIISRIGDIKFIKYKSFDGLEIPAFIIESKAARKPGPTVIYVHGGPWAEVANSWSTFITSLVVSGFHVVAPNFRGSTGYGEEFRKLDIGDPGGGDLQDVVYAAKWALKEKLASKVAIMGYSYGGYMTYLATVKYPDLWSAGVAGAGIVDWEEMYELSDNLFKQFINVLFANKKELLKDRSPITYIENLKAPICIIHPQNDTRTPLKPVLKYISKLLELGKCFEVHIIPDIGHAITKMEDALNILLPAILFLKKRLK